MGSTILMFGDSSAKALFINASEHLERETGEGDFTQLPPRKEPMPDIDYNPEIRKKNGPRVTKEYREEYYRRRANEEKEEERDYRIQIQQLLGKKLHLESILPDLVPKKRKDIRKIIEINAELDDINDQLKELQEESGIDLKKLERGSRIARFIKALKRHSKRMFKKTAEFISENKIAVLNIICISMIVLRAPAMVKSFFGKMIA